MPKGPPYDRSENGTTRSTNRTLSGDSLLGRLGAGRRGRSDLSAGSSVLVSRESLTERQTRVSAKCRQAVIVARECGLWSLARGASRPTHFSGSGLSRAWSSPFVANTT